MPSGPVESSRFVMRFKRHHNTGRPQMGRSLITRTVDPRAASGAGRREDASDAGEAPLIDAILERGSRARETSFHVPGHKVRPRTSTLTTTILTSINASILTTPMAIPMHVLSISCYCWDATSSSATAARLLCICSSNVKLLVCFAERRRRTPAPQKSSWSHSSAV